MDAPETNSNQFPTQVYTLWCSKLKTAGRLRTLRSNTTADMADFSHNDYLGLSQHPQVIAAALRCAQRYGTGGQGSRLLAGNLPIYEQLENKIAKAKKTEAALLFSTGYQANATVLSCLLRSDVLGQEPIVFTDRLNHASLHHGCRLAGVRQRRYRHLDMNHLEDLLKQHAHNTCPKFIVTETVFGMDGDVVDMRALLELADRYSTFVYVDEAHATGVLGPDGYGLSCAYASRIHLAMGTFSKAVGVCGGYVACSKQLQSYLINACTGFIYSTAPSPLVVGAVDAAWQLIPTLEPQRIQLQQRAASLRARVQKLGYSTGTSSTHIFPIILEDNNTTLQAQQHLKRHGVLVSAIRPPTVPVGTARLRVAVCASHSGAQVERLLEALRK